MASSSMATSRTEKHGLFLLSSPSPTPDHAHVGEKYPVDVVAVHGITGDAFDTWTHENENLWLRDFLPNDLLGVRVFSFGYPAEVFCTLSTGNFDSFCRSLLEGLKRERRGKEYQGRPIIFVCHSMGGIIAKKALVTAMIEDELYGSIRKSVIGILFLGTPHRGSSETQLPLILTSIANIALSATFRFIGPMRTELIRALEKDSQILKDISTSFRNQTRNMHIASFIEQAITPPAKARIVDEISGIMDIPGERIVPMMNCNHKSICKFGERSGEGYRTTLAVLQDWVEELDQIILSQEDLSCLHSLAFLEMAHRRLDADRAYPNTCEWILRHESYIRWISQERELLWIKGKPGSGKSTSLAFIYRAYKQQATAKVITLDFFFHGRGAPLQKTPEGMFRSLLHQVFTQCHLVRSSIRTAFKEKRLWGRPEKDWRWHSRELEDLLSNAIIHAAKSYVITIFVDALDEAGAEAARELVSYLHCLKENVVARQGTMKICISSRHYPVIIRSPDLDICVEHENRDDISNYVQSMLSSEGLKEELSTDLTKAWHALANDVIDRASGVFQWARLVVPIIIRLRGDGESLHFIKERLAELPEALGEVYQHIIEKVIEAKNRPRTLFMMQWICLASRPLSATEIRYAMATDCRDDHKSLHICKDAKDFIETDERMTKLVTTLSGGLAEVKQHRTHVIVQLIHQSVHDFLLLDGLRFLSSTSSWDYSTEESRQWINSSNENILGRSHQRLSRSCINYLNRIGAIKTREYPSTEASQRTKRFRAQFPFIDYATKSWGSHSEKAENCDVPMQDLVQQLDSSTGPAFENWTEAYNLLDSWSPKCPEDDSSTILHTASVYNLQSICQALLKLGIDVEEADDSGLTALHHAARWGSKESLQTLLHAHAHIEAKTKLGRTPLVLAVQYGHLEIMKLLLHQGADINIQTGLSGNALQVAALEGNPKVIQMLLEAGADVNNQGGYRGNALQAASNKGHEIIVERLLEVGANVNAQGGLYGNALHAASEWGHEIIVERLLEVGANVNAQGGKHGNALQAASFHGFEVVVERLLEAGANVNAQGGYYGNALQAASARGYSTVIKRLLEAGANVNAQGGYYGTALLAASIFGRKNVMRRLLQAGAQVNLEFHRHLMKTISLDDIPYHATIHKHFDEMRKTSSSILCVEQVFNIYFNEWLQLAKDLNLLLIDEKL